MLRNACTRRHEEGPVVFIYPDDVWYTRVKPEDVPEIVERHLATERLRHQVRHQGERSSSICKHAPLHDWMNTFETRLEIVQVPFSNVPET